MNGTLQKYDEEFKARLEAEYDEEIKNDKERKLKDKLDVRKMIKEHDIGTERLIDMTNHRQKLIQLMIKKDFKSFHTEMRPLVMAQNQQLQALPIHDESSLQLEEGDEMMSYFPPEPTTHTGKVLEAIASGVEVSLAILSYSLV